MISLAFFLANIGIVLNEFVLAPSNTVVVAGEVMRMKCLTTNNSRVRKWDIFTTILESITIYTHGISSKFHRRFKHFGVDVDDNGSGILYTNSTDLSDAGMYKCLSVINSEDKEHSAQLIVLESMPTCEDNFTLTSSKTLLTGDYIWMQCSVSFRGFWTPAIEWIEYGSNLGPEGRNITAGVEILRVPNSIVTSNLTVIVTPSRNGSYFACKIYFAKYDGRYSMTATNRPNFTYNWFSNVINLSFPQSTSIPAALDAGESSTVTRNTRAVDMEKSSSTDWYFISISLVGAFSLFFIVVVVMVVAICIRFKKKLSAQHAPAVSEKVELPVRDGAYDILPYATSDTYEMIDDVQLDAGLTVFFPPRHGPLPIPGYSGLMPMETTAPTVYSRIETYETPIDSSTDSRDVKVLSALETISEKQFGDGNQMETVGEEKELQREGKQLKVHSYIEVFPDKPPNDPIESKTSDCEIPSSYLTVNF